MGPRKVRFADHVAPPIAQPFKSAAILAKEDRNVKVIVNKKTHRRPRRARCARSSLVREIEDMDLGRAASQSAHNPIIVVCRHVLLREYKSDGLQATKDVREEALQGVLNHLRSRAVIIASVADDSVEGFAFPGPCLQRAHNPQALAVQLTPAGASEQGVETLAQASHREHEDELLDGHLRHQDFTDTHVNDHGFLRSKCSPKVASYARPVNRHRLPPVAAIRILK